MLSPKLRRRRARRQRADSSRSQIAEGARPTIALGLDIARRARSPECAPSILGLATQSEGGKLFLPANPWKQTKPNWNPSCSSPFGGRRCNGGDRLAESKAPRPISASLAGNRRGGGCRPRKFSYPQPLEKARNGKGSCDRRSLRRPEPAFRGERCCRLSSCRAAARQSLPARRRSSPPRRPPAAQR